MCLEGSIYLRYIHKFSFKKLAYPETFQQFESDFHLRTVHLIIIHVNYSPTNAQVMVLKPVL
jgi:hypothetical protein